MRKKEEKRTGDAQIHVENEEMSGSDVSDSEVSEMIDGIGYQEKTAPISMSFSKRRAV